MGVSCLGRPGLRSTSQLISHSFLTVLLLQVRLFRFFQIFQILGWRREDTKEPIRKAVQGAWLGLCHSPAPSPTPCTPGPSWPFGQKQPTLVSKSRRDRVGGEPRTPAACAD